MALIVSYHTIATQLPTIDTTIVEGMGVKFYAVSGAESKVVKADATATTFGIAGDSSISTGPNKPYGASVVVNGAGGTRGTSNRVSDFFNETVGSGKITVYTGIGEFYTDQYDTARTYTPGGRLFTNSLGKLTDVNGGGNEVGITMDGPRAYPSGVPGVDDGGVTGNTSAVNGSLSLGSYLRFYMNISNLNQA
jgi:hypothetical protein